MKIKTSITLAEDILAVIDRQVHDEAGNRSEFIERAVRAYLGQLERERRDRRDLDLLNRHAERLNRETADVLEYQTIP